MKVVRTVNTVKTDKKIVNDIKSLSQYTFIFTKINYYLMIAGLIFIALGYVLMIGGGSEDPNVFSDKIFDTQRLVISPILLTIGFVIEIVAIMYRKKEEITNYNKEEAAS